VENKSIQKNFLKIEFIFFVHKYLPCVNGAAITIPFSRRLLSVSQAQKGLL
jgi:hypothetical protein